MFTDMDLIHTGLLMIYIKGAIILSAISPSFATICGPLGFNCLLPQELQLCQDGYLFGPKFICPEDTICQEGSKKVCVFNKSRFSNGRSKEDNRTALETCRYPGRYLDPDVPNCKGYLLCLMKGNTEKSFKFKCGGNTIFDKNTKICSSSERVNCNGTKNPEYKHVTKSNRILKFFTTKKPPYQSSDTRDSIFQYSPKRVIEPVDCTSYMLKIISPSGIENKTTYNCPPKTVFNQKTSKCTIYSNEFCVSLFKSESE